MAVISDCLSGTYGGGGGRRMGWGGLRSAENDVQSGVPGIVSVLGNETLERALRAVHAGTSVVGAKGACGNVTEELFVLTFCSSTALRHTPGLHQHPYPTAGSLRWKRRQSSEPRSGRRRPGEPHPREPAVALWHSVTRCI